MYSYHNDITRFRHFDKVPVKLPFLGIWTVSQSHDGEYTHKDEFRHAWDFVITDTDGKQFSGSGDYPADYYCFDKPVTAPADGTIELVIDNVEDNMISDINVKDNWGNTVIIRHDDALFSSMSHLKKESVVVSEGERVKEGDIIARCGNSGRSPYPHLHFQFQRTPYIGSITLDYPLSYFILNRDRQFILQSFENPGKDEQVSNIEINPLLHNAFHFIPGRKMNFQVERDGLSEEAAWEVQTDPFNNTYIQCMKTHSVAWFKNDSNLLYFTHYEGDKKVLLYFFFLAAYKLQQGFYQDMALSDRYPLNLLFRPPLLTLQDLLAPFWKSTIDGWRRVDGGPRSSCSITRTRSTTRPMVPSRRATRTWLPGVATSMPSGT